MAEFDILVTGGTLPDGRVADIGITGDRIAALGDLSGSTAGEVIEAAGDLVSPPFVDPHFHLDATLSYGTPRINASGTLLEGIALWGELKQTVTVDEMVERALAYCDWAVSLGLLTINALTAAHKVIVPVQCEYLSMRGLIQLQNTLAMIRENLNPDVEIEGILPTLMDTRTVHAKEAIEILEENFGDRVFASRIKKTVRFAEAPVKGMSVLKYDPDGMAAQSYRDLAKEVLTHGKR